ncbi:MAG TPA: hypothetical protein VKA46_18385 [Gemmataceae bacterium]|nr:hypothetical protein [Gemmataceae bacterium]
MVRSIIAVLLGIILAFVVLFALEGIGMLVYPLPEGVSPNDTEALKKLLPNMPVGAFLLVLLGNAVGSLAGGFLGAWMARRAQATHALIVGTVLMLMGVANLLILPGHPAWFWAASLLVYLPPAYLGARMALRPPDAPQVQAAESLVA